MHNDIKFSIIVRIFNAENHLSRQIESVLSQTYRNWELILVNDGSTDCSGNICDQYASRNKKIKVIHQNNSGCTCATINGINKSTGDYCLCIDADDWLDNTLLETAVKYLSEKKYDILEYGFRFIKDNTLYKEYPIVKAEIEFYQMDFLRFTWKTTVHALWNKIISRNCFNFSDFEYKYFTENKINQNEDMLIGITLILSSNIIKIIPECLYNYVIYDESVSHGIESTKKINLAFKTCNVAINLMENRYIDKKDIKSLVINELYREVLPVLPRIIFHSKLDKYWIFELKTYRIYKETGYFVLGYGIKAFLAWFFFRML